MTVLTAQEMQQRVGMRPTLMIGLGGTGQKVLVQLKARFIRNYGAKPSAVEFLCFDTDQSSEQTQIEDKVISLVSGTELVNIGGVQTANIISNLEKYPAIASWILEDKERLPSGTIQMGAKQVRPLGRLSLFWHIETIESKIQAAVNRLTDLKLSFDKKGINVFIISSVCGGTGSGIFVDIAYLTRRVIQDANIEHDSCYVNGVLALPSVFTTVDKTGIEPNAFASLAELDYFYKTEEWNVNYGNPRVPPFSFKGVRPFNICYLVDARNEQGQGLAGMDEIAPMIAEAIYLQISSQVGNANASSFDNVLVLSGSTLYHEENQEKPTAYSSLGTSSLVFPAEKIIELCAYRLGSELLTNEFLRKTIDASRVDSTLNSFLQANQLEAEPLLQALARDSKNNVMKVLLDARQLDRFKEGEVFSATQAYLNKAESTVDNEFSQAIDVNRKVWMERLQTALENETNRLVDDPNGGYYLAMAFLDKLDATLVFTRGELDKSRAEIDQRRDRFQASLQQTQNAFAQSFRSNPIGRGGRIKEARNRHVETAQNSLSARFESKKREAAISLLANLSSTIQSRRTLLQRIVEKLQFIQSQFGSYVERFGKGKPRVDFVLAQDITTDADIDRYYTEHYTRLGTSPVSVLVNTEGPLHNWLAMDQDEISDRILRYCRTAFEDIKEITVEQIILEKKGQVDPAKQLLDLINRSVPFWRYRTAGKLAEGWGKEEKIVVIGVADKERSIYKNIAETGQQLTSTFDPHQIIVLQTKHGIPLFALTQYDEFKQKHDNILQRRLKPLYVFPEVRPGGEKVKQIFALGVAYGYIFKSGVYYYITPTDPGDQPILLNQGMTESLQVLRNNSEQISLISKMVEDQISKEGSAAAIQTLEGFINEAYVYELKGGAARTNIDRSIMLKDITVSRPGGVNFDLVRDLRNTVRAYIAKVLRG